MTNDRRTVGVGSYTQPVLLVRSHGICNPGVLSTKVALSCLTVTTILFEETSPTR